MAVQNLQWGQDPTQQQGYTGNIAGRRFGSGGEMPGSTDASALGDPRAAAVRAIQQGMSTANPADQQSQDALRGAYQSRLSSLQGNAQGQKNQMDTDLQKGFQQQNDMLRRGAAGSGAYGSNAYGNEVGNLSSQYANARNQGILGIENNLNSQLGQVGAGLSGVENQDMQQRQFAANQQNQLANNLLGINQSDINVGMQQKQMDQQQANSNNQLLGSLAGTLGTIGGMAAFGPLGGMAGNKLGSSISGYDPSGYTPSASPMPAGYQPSGPSVWGR